MSSKHSVLLNLEESLTDSPHYRSRVRDYEEYAGSLDLAIQGLSKASRQLQQVSQDCSTKSIDMLRRISSISQLSPLKDPLIEQSLVGFGDVLSEIERNRVMQTEQLQHILVAPMEEMADQGLLQRLRGARRRVDMLQGDYESQLTRLMTKKVTEPMIEVQEKDVEKAKSRYINQMQLLSVDLNRLASVKKVEFLEGFLSLMYAQYAFYHQAFSSLKDFEPTMRQLGEHVARARREAEAEIAEAKTAVVDPVINDTGGALLDDDGYVQVGQQEDDATFGSVRSIETLGESLGESLDLAHGSSGTTSKNSKALAIKTETPAGNPAPLSAHSVATASSASEASKAARPTHRRKTSKSHRKSLASISLSPTGLFQISGYLFLRSQYSLMSSWQRRWFEIKDGYLVHFQRLDEKDREMIPLHLCMVKRGPAQDRRNVFELIAPTRSYLLQAENNDELSAWKACLKQAIETSLYSHTPITQAIKDIPSSKQSTPQLAAGIGASLEMHSAVSSKPSSRQSVGTEGSGVNDSAAQAARMSKMRNPHGNDRCVDCSKRAPEWAAINLGVLMCIECSGIHRSLGVHVSKVRSVKLDNWEPELMQIMQRLGNHCVNRIYESVEPQQDDPQKPASQTSREAKLPYLVQKYANRLWVAKPESQEEADAKLVRAARLADMPMALEALAQGADVNAHDPKTGSTPLIEAVAMGDFGMLELLFLWGADANTRAKMTATEYISDSPKISQDGKPALADGSAVDREGEDSGPRLAGGTALHFATRLGNVRVVWYLIRRGAEWDTPDAYGLLPLDIALEDSNVQVVMALRYAAFQKASGLPPGTLGSSRPRHHSQGNGGGEPVDMLDMDDSFIRDWAIPPFSPYVGNGQQQAEDSSKATPADRRESRTSGEFTEFVDSTTHANASADADFEEPPATDDENEASTSTHT